MVSWLQNSWVRLTGRSSKQTNKQTIIAVIICLLHLASDDETYSFCFLRTVVFLAFLKPSSLFFRAKTSASNWNENQNKTKQLYGSILLWLPSAVIYCLWISDKRTGKFSSNTISIHNSRWSNHETEHSVEHSGEKRGVKKQCAFIF